MEFQATIYQSWGYGQYRSQKYLQDFHLSTILQELSTHSISFQVFFLGGKPPKTKTQSDFFWSFLVCSNIPTKTCFDYEIHFYIEVHLDPSPIQQTLKCLTGGK